MTICIVACFFFAWSPTMPLCYEMFTKSVHQRCKDHPSVLISVYSRPTGIRAATMEYRVAVLGANFNITSLGNKARCRTSAQICSYCSVFVCRSIEPDIRLRSDYNPHYKDGPAQNCGSGNKAREAEMGGVWKHLTRISYRTP